MDAVAGIQCAHSQYKILETIIITITITIHNVQLIQSRIQQQFTPKRQRVAAMVLAWLFIFIAIWWLALLTWRLLTPADTLVVAPAQNQTRLAQASTNVRAIQQLKIFGDRAAVDAQQEDALDAPETTLNVRLVGLVASANPQRSAAIIEQSGSQQTYIIGERIGNSRATVEQILPDRVLLDNGGRREVLYMEGRDGSEAQLRMFSASANEDAQPRQSTQPTRVDTRRNPQVAEAVASARENPAMIMEIINISPVRDGQQITGYQLQPREDRELFAALGLQAGDIAVAINGYDLTDPAQALAAMNELQDSSRAIIQVRRGNDIIDLELQVP